MKLMIQENERGYLFEQGKFVRLLGPGRHTVWEAFGQSAVKVAAEGSVNTAGMPVEVLMRDTDFAAAVAGAQVPDNHVAMHFVNGRLAGMLPAGEHWFWNLFSAHTFTLLDIAGPEAGKVPVAYFDHIPLKLYAKVEVAEGEVGLLYFNGEYQRKLQSGVHYFWNKCVKVQCQKVDMRVQQMDIPGQEILTADKVALRLNFVCSYKVEDPVRLLGELKDYEEQIYSTVQLALREYVGRFKLDELLEQKQEIADFVLQKLQSGQGRLYIQFLEAGLKDVILPGEIREIMNTVLVAEKKAQANVIARREEVASTRSLLNTAKLLDENATLAKLKEMESLERIFDKVGSISVSGSEGLLAQLKDIAGIRR